MTYRFLLKKKWELSLIGITIIFLYIWTDGFGSSSIPIDYNYIENYQWQCPFPCSGEACKDCESDTDVTIKTIDIADHLKLRQALRNEAAPKTSPNRTQEEQVCRRPNFDLKHDSVKYAFYHMKKLNCSREELFYRDKKIFRFNTTRIGDRELEKCVYDGIERASDDYITYTYSLTKKHGPFDLILKHDFVRIRCYLKKNDSKIESDGDNDSPDLKKDVGGEILKEITLNRLSNNETLKYQKEYDSTVNDHDMGEVLKNTENNLLKETAVLEKKLKLLTHTDDKISNAEINRKHSLNKPNIASLQYLKNLRDLNQSFNSHQAFDRGRNLLSDNYYHEDANNAADDDNDDEYDDDDDRLDHYPFDPFYSYESDDEPEFFQLFAQIYPKTDVFKRIKSIQPKTDFHKRPNVLMFGLDSMSHLSYQRKLPNTYRYLKERLGAVVLEGYNIVGDATTAALIPILTGKTEVELPEARKNRFDSVNVDVFPFVWKKFRKHGYVTMYAEDEPSIGVFNLRLNGFQDQPTDHYMRPFWQALWDSSVREQSPRYCTGNVQNHQYLLDYTKDFFDKYSNVSKFAFVFGSELTHWDNNPGEYMDQDFVNFLEYLRLKGHLDNTVLVVYADHGARYSRVRNTVQGKMEERLPMMSFTFPQWFRDEYSKLYENLVANADRLSTPFDIHETLEHILRLSNSGARQEYNTVVTDKTLPRGISLLNKIPAGRTCASAHIDVHWCTCLKELELDLSDVHVQKAVNALVRFLNKETEDLRDLCAELKFRSLHHASLLIPNEKVLMFQKSVDADQRVANFTQHINVDHAHFQITIETSPNKGLYETTVQVNMTAGTYTVMETQVSRLDRYGNQPACVQQQYPDLRKYCFCKPHDTRG